MAFKFEKLEVWQMALEYTDSVYEMAEKLPESEKFNLRSQITRAATSVALNRADASAGQTDPGQSRFPGLALRSPIETVGCLRIIKSRQDPSNDSARDRVDSEAVALAVKIQVFRRACSSSNYTLREVINSYELDLLEH